MPKQYPYYWNEGQPKTIRFSYEDTLGGYRHMLKIILNVLETVLESPVVVEPDSELNTRYTLLLEYFYSIHLMRSDFKHIPNVRFEKFASLIEIDNKFIQSWKEEKPRYLEQLRIIDGQYLSLTYGDSFKVPRNLTFLTDSLADLLSRHKRLSNPSLQEKKRSPLPPNFTWKTENSYSVGTRTVDFESSKDNDRKTIFKMLTKANGEPVRVRDMEHKIDNSPQKVRIIVSQLKDKIKNTGLTIQTERKGAYWLTFQK